MNKAALFGSLALALTACNDDDTYPGCDNSWWGSCEFAVSSWNLGSENYWIYGADAQAYYFFNGAEIGRDYVAIPRSKAEACSAFDRHDVMTWSTCDDSLEFNCAFSDMAKETYNRYSSETAHKDKKYPPLPDGPNRYSCDL
ncbi:hypothetical protein [Litoreibacter janthinus]|nr:hypothetical protein [Litoreibacter janthinus]